MNKLSRIVLATILGGFTAFSASSVLAAPAAPAAAEKAKNWAPPTHKIYAQVLSDQIMAPSASAVSRKAARG